MSDDDTQYTPAEVATKLRVAENWVLERAKQHRGREPWLPCTRAGRSITFTRAQFQQIRELLAQPVPPKPAAPVSYIGREPRRKKAAQGHKALSG